MIKDARFSGPTALALTLLAALAPTAPADAQQAAEPWEAGCLLTKLDPNGDGFLSIRRGPGSDYQEIARVRNGDALYIDTRKCQGQWCLAEGASVNGRETDLTGWFYTAWCEMYP
ncbi:MAG: hypothetical protein AAF390_13690 [Pseudomonadota bacterium]